MLTKDEDEARIAVNIARLPELPGGTTGRVGSR
jgi:hypothetical protein